MALMWNAKSPANIEDYAVDWTVELGGDVIATSNIALITAAGLSIVSQSNTTTSSTVFLSGGSAGQTAILRATITTAGGRTFVEDIQLPISDGLIVEDGTGLATAQAFVTVADADAYCAANRVTFSGSVADKERALRVGAQWLTYSCTFKGMKTKNRKQALAFPRVGCTDAEDYAILSNEVPFEVVYANIELGAFELANPGALTPSVILADRVRVEKVGPIETTYALTGMPSPDLSRPVLTKVNDLLGGLLDAGSGSYLFGSSIRG